MSHRYLHDFSEERSKEAQDQEGTERLEQLSVYPIKESLPPLPGWHRRCFGRMWSLFPCTLCCLLVSLALGAGLFLWGNGWEPWVFAVVLLGMLLDARFSLGGKMIDD